MSKISIKLDNGKYEVKETASGSLVALRHGEVWRDLCGDNLIYNMASEIESLRAQLAEANEFIEAVSAQCESVEKQLEAQSGEAVAWIDEAKGFVFANGKEDGDFSHGTKFYTSPPAVKVPEWASLKHVRETYGDRLHNCDSSIVSFRYGWNACREAMLAAQEGEK